MSSQPLPPNKPWRSSRRNTVDVALVDYMLPDLDGFALSKRIRETASHTKIILMTGGGEMSVSDESGLGPNVPVLQKPFLVDDVLNLIRSRVPMPSADGSISAAG